MQSQSLVAIGASAGGVEALMRLVGQLPATLAAAVGVVVHQPPRERSQLAQVIARYSSLRAVEAEHGAELQSGTIYVTPPDVHLVVQRGESRLLRSARENGHRPSIDTFFRSAARSYGPAAVGVILSGADDDGTEGLLMIKAAGGAALVQDPKEALFSRMPRSAATHVEIDALLPLARLGNAIEQAVSQTESRVEVSAMQSAMDPRQGREQLEQRISAWHDGGPADSATGFSCPLCGGGIWMGNEGPLTRLRCHTGHEFSGETFLEEQAMVLESTLWQAVRVLSERESLLQRLSQQAPYNASRLTEQANELKQGVTLLRQLLTHVPPAEPAEPVQK